MKLNTKSLRTKSRKELANEYNISVRTFRRWLARHNIKIPSGLVSPIYIRKIYQTFGEPPRSN